MEAFDLHCIDKITIQDIDVFWNFGEKSYMICQYENFNYYMEVEALSSQEELFALIEELLN